MIMMVDKITYILIFVLELMAVQGLIMQYSGSKEYCSVIQF